MVKSTQVRHFWSQIQAFLFSHEILQTDKFEGADFKYHNGIFKILAQKYPNKAFFGQKHPNKAFLFFREILQSDKFEGADFKYNNIVFKFQPKTTQIRRFWSQI